MPTGNFLRAYINKISLKRGHEILCGTLAYLYPFSVLFACNANDWNYMILQLYIERTGPPLNITEVHPIYRSVMLDLNFWACTKRRNVETKRPKRNGRNHRNHRNDRNETTETKQPKRNDRNETAETKRPKRNGRKYKLQEKWKIY